MPACQAGKQPDQASTSQGLRLIRPYVSNGGEFVDKLAPIKAV